MSSITYRPDIDALRGVAVLLVVIFHAFPAIIPGGFIGVDVFFVISGYLITTIILTSIEKGNFSIKEFYSRRVKRLFPALIVVLLVTLLFGWLVLFPDEFKQLGGHAANSAIYVLNYILIGEVGYFDVDARYKPLLHLWTLAVEEQYYIFWPILLLLISKQKIIEPSYFIFFIIIVSFVANLYYINNYPEAVYFHTLTRVWQLALGSLLAVLLLTKTIPENRKIAITGLVLIVVSALTISESTAYPGWAALFPTAGAMLVIFGNIRIFQWGGMLKLGLISYPLYLWHWVVISFVTIYMGGAPSLIAMTVAVIVSLLLAWITYRYIEPIRYSKRKSIAKILFIILIVVGLIGLFIKDQNGINNRAHLNYLEKFNVEFIRTPAVDKLCDQFVKSMIGGVREFDYCRTDNIKAEKHIAIIGDSHAHASYPGIAKIANEFGYGAILLANSSCPTLIGFEWGRNEKEIALCKKKIAQIMRVIEQDNKIEKIIIVTRGPVYIHGEVDEKFSNQSVDKSLAQNENNRQTYDSYYNGLRNLFNKLIREVKIDDVYYFLENPELDFLPKETIIRPFDSWGFSSRSSVMDKNLYLKRMRKYRLAVNRAIKGTGVTVIDPIDYMCDSAQCFSYKESIFLYADDDHFSVYGSNFIADKMKSVLFNDNKDN